MSTKTTFKRIALVAVAALGFGVLTSVAPASARTSSGLTEYINAISVSTDYAPVAGVNGTVVKHTVTFKASTTAAVSSAVNPAVILASAPATSTLTEGTNASGAYTTTAAGAASTPWTWHFTTASTDATTAAQSTNSTQNLSAGTGDTSVAAGYSYLKNYLFARYDVAGTYSWVFFDDLNSDGIVNGSEYAQTISVVVTAASLAASLKATVTPYNSEASTSGTVSGSLVKITLTDAAGNPANVDAAGGILVTVDHSAKISLVNVATDPTDSATYTLGRNDFDGSGRAWVNVVDATAETVALTLTGTGSAATSFVAPAATNLTFTATCTASCAATLAAKATATTVNTVAAAGTVRYVTSGASVTASFKTGNTSDTVPSWVQLQDGSGKVTGKTSATADLVIYGSSTATDKGLFTITSTFSAAGQAYTLVSQAATTTAGSAPAGTSYVNTATAATNGAITMTQSVLKAGVGAAVTLKGNLVDSFGAGASNVTITPSISGRNSALVLSTLVTDASGDFTFTYTDASTSTTSLVDTITFTPATGTAASATVTRVSAANLGVTSILVSTPSTNSYAATTLPGEPTTVKSYSEITAAYTGAQSGAVTVYALVKDAAGVAVEGVPVVWTVTGTGCAIKSTLGTTYTDNTGVASNAGLYAWVSGDCTVTATYGTVSDSAVSSWRQTGEARTISVAAVGGVVTATVKDRYGNPVVGSAVSATRTGAGYFANGTSSVSNALTGANGTVDFIFVGAGTVTVNNGADTAATSYGDDIAAAGKIGTTTATAATTGTATTAETGVGSSLTPAGIHSASVAVDAANVAADNAQAATDAAAEATDAANAATDAANAAAEAADAATAAAQDAADAVAALSTQVSEMIDALKKQITALTNLVIKIQKKVKA